MTPLIGFINDCDAPSARMLVLVWGNPANPSVEYINERMSPLADGGAVGTHYGCFPPEFTELSRFGVTAEFKLDGNLRVRRIGPSAAFYRDGKPRRWQGADWEVIGPRRRLAGLLIDAVQALQAEQRAELAEAALA